MRDEPLFMTEAEPSENHGSEDLTTEEYNIRQENRRKNTILKFGFNAMIWILIFSVVLIIADLFAQAFELNSSLIEDYFALIEYIIPALLGYIFGRKTSE